MGRQQAEARKAAEAQQAASTEQAGAALPWIGDLPILELIPRLNPANERPYHLPWLLEQLEEAIAPHEGQRYRWFSVPPRHWKTTTLEHAIAKHLIRWPDQTVLFVTHTDDYARKVSRNVRKLAVQAGLRLSKVIDRQDEWELETGGGLVAKAINSGVAGRGFRLIVCDDPFKGREDAKSKARRDSIFDIIDDDLLTRLSPDGTLFLVHTRWHPDDAIGRFKKRHDWDGRNIPALRPCNDNDPEPTNDLETEVALLPSRWGVAYLRGIRKANPYKFASLYQGEPMLPGEALFREPARYEWPDQRPKVGYQVAYGVDLAYSSNTIGDWSVCLRLLRVDSGLFEVDEETRRRKRVWHYYVTDVVRKHVDAPSFALSIKAMHSEEPGPMRWDRNTVEQGSADFIKRKLPNGAFRDVLAKGKPVDRIQYVSEQWNLGRVFVPGGEQRPDWVDDFVDELTTMTGMKDSHDDQAVALASAFELLRERDTVSAYGKARALRGDMPKPRD